MNDDRRKELEAELSRILENHQSARRDLEGALYTIQRVLRNTDHSHLELQEIHRELEGRFHPGIRISDTEVVLPGDKVLIKYHASQREGIVTHTQVYDSTPFSPGPMEPSMDIYVDGSTSCFEPNRLHQLSLIGPKRHTPLPDPSVFEVGGVPVSVGDRVESKELGPGTVRYLVELPKLGLYVQFDKDVGERTPTFLPHKELEFLCREGEEEEKADSKPPEDDDTQTADSTETETDPLFSAIINGVRVHEGYLFKDKETGRRVGEVRFVPEYRGSQPGYGLRLKIDGYRKLYPATFSDLNRYSFYPNPESLVMIGEGVLVGVGDQVEVEADGVPLGTRGKIVEINRDLGKVSVEIRVESSGKLKTVYRYDVHPRYLLPLEEVESEG